MISRGRVIQVAASLLAAFLLVGLVAQVIWTSIGPEVAFTIWVVASAILVWASWTE